jgi:DNA-binding transcriptional LysR family regulator
MRLDDMKVFATVVDSGGFTAAGQVLGLPKSSISRRIQGLEEFLGVRLLQRTTRKIRLTDAGERYYADCVRIVKAADYANHKASETQAEPRGVLRLTAPPLLGEAFLGPLVCRYLARWPEVRVELDLSSEHRDLISGQYDLAIRIGALEDSSYVARRLGDARGMLCAAPSYIARRGAPTDPNSLVQHDMIEFGNLGAPFGRHRFGQGVGSNVTVVQFEPRFRGNSIAMLIEALHAGVGIGWLPSYTADSEFAAGRLVPVLTAYPMPKVPVHAVYPSRENLAAKSKAFIDLVLEQNATSPPWAVPPPLATAPPRSLPPI